MTIISASDPSAPTSSSQAINASATLGQNDFLKLLVAQLKYQDPMKPTDSSQFMGEMAQFSTVQGVTSMGTTMEGMSHANDVSQAIALIGKDIRYKALDGTIGSGTVIVHRDRQRRRDAAARRRRRRPQGRRRGGAQVLDPLLPGQFGKLGGVGPAQAPATPRRAARAHRRPVVRRRARPAGVRPSPLHFSGHALQRIERRGINLDAGVLARLGDGVARAAAKGSRDSRRARRPDRVRGLRPQPHRHHGRRSRPHARARVHEHRQRRHLLSPLRTPIQPPRPDLQGKPRQRKAGTPNDARDVRRDQRPAGTPDDARRRRQRHRQHQHRWLQERADDVQGRALADPARRQRRLGCRRRHERHPDRPRRPARLDLEQDGRRRDPADRQPARPRDPGRRVLPRRRRRGGRRHRGGDLHPRGQLHARRRAAASSPRTASS